MKYPFRPGDILVALENLPHLDEGQIVEVQEGFVEGRMKLLVKERPRVTVFGPTTSSPCFQRIGNIRD